MDDLRAWCLVVFDWPERVAPGAALACSVTDAWLLPEP